MDDAWEPDVPGNASGLLTSNTELGKAVNEACDEMHHLGGLENDVLQEAQGLLEKLGYKKSIFEADEKEDSQIAKDTEQQ